MKKRRSLAALLCLCLLAGSLPARALDLGGLALPAYRTEELEQAAHQAAELDVDLVVMDCIGYTVEMKEHFQAVSGKPVVLSRTLAARVVMELLP